MHTPNTAADAAEAAGAQGLFWEVHGTLFERQRELDDQQFVRYAREIGADEQTVLKDLTSGSTLNAFAKIS